MDTKNLNKILSQITALHIESRKPQSLEIKMEQSSQCSVLVHEASKIIDEMQYQITKLDTPTNIENIDVNKIDHFLELLENNNLNFNETLYIAEQLLGCTSKLPIDTQVIEHNEKEVIYEEQNVVENKN